MLSAYLCGGTSSPAREKIAVLITVGHNDHTAQCRYIRYLTYLLFTTSYVLYCEQQLNTYCQVRAGAHCTPFGRYTVIVRVCADLME